MPSALRVSVDDLFDAWGLWCAEQGREQAGLKHVFSRDLRAVLPGLTTAQIQVDGERFRAFDGIELNPSAKASLEHHRATKNGRIRWAGGSPV